MNLLKTPFLPTSTCVALPLVAIGGQSVIFIAFVLACGIGERLPITALGKILPTEAAGVKDWVGESAL